MPINYNFDKEFEKAMKKLDTIEFYPYFKANDDFEDVINILESEFGDILNIITRSEFVEYINKRYKDKINIYEVSCYRYKID